MPTADQIETHMVALQVAATQLNTDGATLDGAGQIPVAVTATSTKQYVIKTYTGQHGHAHMKQDFDRGMPPMVGTNMTPASGGVVLVYDDAVETIVIARVKK